MVRTDGRPRVPVLDHLLFELPSGNVDVYALVPEGRGAYAVSLELWEVN